MPIAEQLTEPLMDVFMYGKETTVSGSTYITGADISENPNRLFSALYYTQWWQEPVQQDKFYDPRYLTFFAFRVNARQIYPHPSDSSMNGPISVDVCLLDGSPMLSNAYIYKKVAAPADYNNWVYFPVDNANFRTEYVILSHAYNGALRTQEDCFDENNNPIRGTSYISVDEVQAEYRQWIIDDTFMTAELALLTPISDYEPPIPYSQWRKQDDEIKLGFGVEELPDFEEVLPLSSWRYDTTQLVCPYCTEMRGTPVIHKVFHRLLPGHVAPEPPPPEPDEPFDDIPTLEYDVYCDGKPLHIAQSPLEGYRIIDGVLTLNDSAAGAFEFTIGAFHSLYNSILMMASTITVNLNGEEIWEGRPVSFKENLWKDHVVTCEGELAYLNDIFLPPMVYTNTTPDVILRNIIDGSDRPNEPISGYAYNAKCSENRKIYVGSVPTPDASKYSVDVDKYVVNYDTVLNIVLDICKKYGYHVYVEKRIVDGVKKRYLVFLGDDGYGENASQKIIFGRNLVDYSKSYNFANIVTALLPLGAKISSDKKVTIDDTQAGLLTPDQTINDRVVERYTYYVDRTKYQVVRAADSDESPSLQYPAYYSVKVLDLYERNYNYIYVTTNMKGPTTFDNGAKREPALFAIYVPDGQGGGTFYDAKFTKGTAQEGTVLNKHKIDVTSYQTMQGAQLCIGLYDDGTFNSFEIRKSKTSDETTEEYITIRDVSGAYSPTTGEDINALYAISTAEDEEHKTPIQRYGRIEKKVEWSEVKDSSTLYNNAKAYLDSDQFDGLQIELTAMDMKMFDINVNRLRVGEYVRCVAPPYGLDKLMPIRSLKIPILKPEDAKYTVGDSRQTTLTSNSSASNDELARLIGEKPTMGSVLVAAKQSAYDSLVNSTGNSYVTFRYGDDEKIQAIIVSDSEKYEDSTNGYWIWNARGLGFVRPNDVEDQVPVALTSDGRIVADFIATGTMAADRIFGGTLKLGNWSISPGGGAPTYRTGGKFWIYGTASDGYLPNAGDNIDPYPMIRIGRGEEGNPNNPLNYDYGLEFIEPMHHINQNDQSTYGSYISIKGGRIYFTGHGNDGEPKVAPGGNMPTIACTSVVGNGYFNDLAFSVPSGCDITFDCKTLGFMETWTDPDTGDQVSGIVEATRVIQGGSESFTPNVTVTAGDRLEFRRGILMVVQKGGGVTPISDGNHTIHDGDIITTENGVITNITTPSNNNE